jgi:hypothetical protein
MAGEKCPWIGGGGTFWECQEAVSTEEEVLEDLTSSREVVDGRPEEAEGENL